MSIGYARDVTPSLVSLLVDATERYLADALGRLDELGFGGVTVSHAFAVQLVGAGVTTITALAEAMRMTPQAVSSIVNQLEARALVVRGRAEQDARAKTLTLTVEGRRLAEAIATVLADGEGAWAELVGAERLEDVRATLATYVADAASAAGPTGRRRQRRVRLV